MWITAGCLSPTVMCPTGTTCGRDARCEAQRDPVLVPFVPLASFDAGAPVDAASDAPRTDAAPDGPGPTDVPMNAGMPPDVPRDVTVPSNVPMDVMVPPDVPIDVTVPTDGPVDVPPDLFRGSDVPPVAPVLGTSRPIYPFNGARLRSNTTTFRWENQMATGLRSRMRICRDRECVMTESMSPIDTATIVSYVSTVDLAEGVHFWRVEAVSTSGAVVQMSPTFEFVYEQGSVPQPVARGVVGDYNADGLPDLLVGSPAVGAGAGSVQVF